MLRAVIFDLDGVIVDSHPAHLEAWKTFFRSIGKEFTECELSFVLDGRKREEILRHFLGDLTEEQVRYYGAWKESLFCNAVPELRTIRGLSQFLDQLETARLPLAVASSASRGRAGHMLEQLNLSQRFQVMVTGDDVKNGKPDPSIFRLAADGLEVAPADTLVCEDAVAGVQAAKAAGMKCLAIADDGRGPVLNKAGADLVVLDFSEANLDDLRRLFAE